MAKHRGWEIVETAKDVYDVLRDGRAYRYDVEGIDNVKAEVRSRRRSSEDVTLVDLTGYREALTL